MSAVAQQHTFEPFAPTSSFARRVVLGVNLSIAGTSRRGGVATIDNRRAH